MDVLPQLPAVMTPNQSMLSPIPTDLPATAASELLTDAELARLRLVLTELRLRLQGMCEWLSEYAPQAGQTPSEAAFADLARRFSVLDKTQYQLSDFSALWGLTSNPFQEIFDLVYVQTNDADAELNAALAQFCQQLAVVPNAILAEVTQALRDPECCERACRSLRRFHDFWIDCAERAFVATAHSAEMAQAQGQLLNVLAQRANEQQSVLKQAEVNAT